MATIRSTSSRKKRPAPPRPAAPQPSPSSVFSTATRPSKKRPAPPPPSFTLRDGLLTSLITPQSPLPSSAKIYTSLPRRWYKRSQHQPKPPTSPPPSTLRRMMSLLSPSSSSSSRRTPEEVMEIADLGFIEQLEKEGEKPLVHASIVHQPFCAVGAVRIPCVKLVKVVTVDPVLGKSKFFSRRLISVDSCNCFKRSGESCKNPLELQLFVESSTSHDGPIFLSACWMSKMSEIQARVTRVLLIPPGKQRWIIGKSLVTNFQWSLASYGIKENDCRIFLYVVQPVRQESDEKKQEVASPRCSSVQLGQKSEDNDVLTRKTLERNASEVIRQEVGVNREIDEKRNARAVILRQFNVENREPNVETVNHRPVDQKKSIEVIQPSVEVKDMKFDEKKPKLPRGVLLRQLDVKQRQVEDVEVVNLGQVDHKLPTEVIQERVEVKDDVKVDQKPPEIIVQVPSIVVQDRALADLLLLADAQPVTRNAEDFVCPVCFEIVPKGAGVVLKDCLHCFCQDCLIGTIENAEDSEIKCPFSDLAYSCQAILQDREIKALVPVDIYERLQRKSLNTVEARLESYHCSVKDCPGWVEKGTNAPSSFICPVCSKTTCIKCSIVHQDGENCTNFEEKRKKEINESEELLKEMLKRDEKNTMECPTCHVVILRKWGCDWLRCALCKTEICWVTRGPRWGPNGKGDTSGGCRCRVNGVPCHPSCRYCH